ncbi:hypothetical protein HYW61_01905 [candidate division WWE3 bacterium]|nr:hypothetical protein [candidate division WWE3 bacterium]
MMKKNPIPDHLEINIRNRDKVYYEERAVFLSSKNKAGPFDILPQHANFITLLSGPIRVKRETGEEVIVDASEGVLRVAEGRVDVYL